uniref:WD_REPEATS_REGION domain-containing protein n=1 Tax=Heterorhabditis bacteriophora TaxID=37862 RepID=A0A1I7X051_HETBA
MMQISIRSFQTCTKIQWHPRLNQIIVGLSDGSMRFFDSCKRRNRHIYEMILTMKQYYTSSSLVFSKFLI